MVVSALAAWGSRHADTGTALVNEACGHPVQIGYFCPACETRVRGASVKLVRTAARTSRTGRPARKEQSAHYKALGVLSRIDGRLPIDGLADGL
jgi:hypothetical protein